MRSAAVMLALSLAFGGRMLAHDVTRSEAKIDIRGREARVAFTLNLTELRDPALHFDNTGRITIAGLDRSIAAVFDSVKRHYELRSPEPPVATRLEQYVLLDGHAVHLQILYEFARDLTQIEITSTLYQVMNPGHRHLMTVMLNGTLHEGILDAASHSVTFTGVQPTRFQTAWKFVLLGVEHIFTGYDHLAFLLGLLVATTSLKSLVQVITSFTLAHSITLALATFNLVMLPTRLTESVIALSIGYVAAENLAGFRVMKRYYVTFLFGLVHGFGFSNVLREMDLPRASLALSLFSFNLGVELGQIAFVLLVFPLVRDLVKSGWRHLQPALSAGIACLAVYWFVQRAFFS